VSWTRRDTVYFIYLSKLKDTAHKPSGTLEVSVRKPAGVLVSHGMTHIACREAEGATLNYIKKSSYRDILTCDFLTRFKSLIVQHC
jgi:hypothetical protein